MQPITLSPGGGFLLEATGSATIVTAERLDDDHLLMKQTADDFMRREVEPRVAEIEEKQPGLLTELLRKAGDVGLLGHDVPEAYGGLGGDKMSSSLIFESMSRVGSWAVTFGAHTGIGTMPLVLFGNDEQRARYLPRLASGELVAAYALTEPSAGSDALAAKTTARLTPDGKHYRLDGSKIYITNGGIADLYTVFAKIDGEKFTAFLVERQSPGLSVGNEEHKLGIRGSSTTPLFFEGALVPVENLLGQAGQGHKIAFNILNIGRWKLGVGATGGAKHALELGVRFARERQQFGKPIAGFQLVQDLLVRMLANVTSSACLCLRLSQLQQAGQAEDHHSALAKAFCTVRMRETVGYARELLGGNGILLENHVGRFVADAEAIYSYEGTREMNTLIVGRAITGTGAFV